MDYVGTTNGPEIDKVGASLGPGRDQDQVGTLLRPSRPCRDHVGTIVTVKAKLGPHKNQIVTRYGPDNDIEATR